MSDFTPVSLAVFMATVWLEGLVSGFTVLGFLCDIFPD
ncbi:hypothetical protein Sinf_0542 [Streptococcus infantarius subsp. infantarius CJ18]|nr:hypothetical protein Sinf_0542 [Streptococcus infantarius subsp. infantarius CJ18]